MTSSSKPGKKSNPTSRTSSAMMANAKRSEKASPESGASSSTGDSPVYASDVVAMVKRKEAAQKHEAAARAAGRSQKGGTPIKAEASAAVMSLPGHVDELPIVSLDLPEIPDNVPMQDRPGLVLRMAEEAFAKTGSWVVFYRELLGPGGVVDQLYDTPEARRYFEKSPQFADLLEMVTAIRSQDDSKAGAHEPERVITVRLPRSLHAAAVREAEELELTINSYCLTKLLQPAGARFTPVQSGVRRGRRPGPQISFERIKVRIDQGDQGTKSGRKRKSKATRRK
ncbi:hypothetical protein [Neorhodopirellula pilleata]|uniref:HicB family protein n=1 Tax=Neorhodopirellula pilleata TaxID=2714738 RepID=A0A5C5ZIZ8_9BACT|nr:hypothetical protein [Neorhodopirellula pilleata]TWT86977.1 hypothetical protein Pla100_60040 [Neorhodopirellula pilleata]